MSKLKSVILNPNKMSGTFPDAKTNQVMKDVRDHLENFGKLQILKDVANKRDLEDWYKYQGSKNVYSTMLTPAGYGNKDTSFDLSKISAISELLAFYNPSIWYTFQVSLLGVCPIWMSDNEYQKNELAKLLNEGHIFAFGLSEKEHGANIYASEASLRPTGDGEYRANGAKYYIGNAFRAPKIPTLGKNTETGEWVYYVIDSRHENYNYVKNIETGFGSARVGEFRVCEYPITDKEILTSGQEAFDNALLTVNIGKYMVGCAALGIATHGFYEAITHANRRKLYDGMLVTDFPHIREFFNDAFCRLNAMKLYTTRGIDYMRVLSADDRRYLLFSPIQKMKVTKEADDVMATIMDIVCAKGYEADTYLSHASTIAPYLSRLEGTVHVNMSLVLKFIKGYFFGNKNFEDINQGNYVKDDSNIFTEQKFGGLSKVQFDDCKKPYVGVEIANVKIFSQIIDLYKEMIVKAPVEEKKRKDLSYMLNLGHMFTEIVYAQLILEQALISNVDDELINQIFATIIKDFNKYAVAQFNYQENTSTQNEYLQKLMAIVPELDKKKENEFFEEFVQAQDGEFIMTDSVIGQE